MPQWEETRFTFGLIPRKKSYNIMIYSLSLRRRKSFLKSQPVTIFHIMILPTLSSEHLRDNWASSIHPTTKLPGEEKCAVLKFFASNAAIIALFWVEMTAIFTFGGTILICCKVNPLLASTN